MNRSMKDLEREIEESRARLDQTIDRLQDKLSVSSAVDEVIGGVRRSQYGGVVERVLTSIRNNPVPVLVALAGVGWLLRRVEREGSAAGRAEMRPPPRSRPARYPPPTARDTGFIRDTDIDPDLQPYGVPGLEPERPSAPTPDPTRPARRRSLKPRAWNDPFQEFIMADNQNDNPGNGASTGSGPAGSGPTGSGTAGTYSTDPTASVGGKAPPSGASSSSNLDENLERGREYYERAREKGRDALHDAQEQTRRYVDEGRRRGERYYDEARSRAEHYYDEAADWARDNYEHASDWTHDRYSDARRYGREGYRSTARFAQENPLLVGVIALATGMLVGAMLPRTRQEDRTMGPYADDMRRRGGRYARDFSRHGFSEDESHPIHESEWRRRRDEEAEAAERTRPGEKR